MWVHQREKELESLPNAARIRLLYQMQLQLRPADIVISIEAEVMGWQIIWLTVRNYFTPRVNTRSPQRVAQPKTKLKCNPTLRPPVDTSAWCALRRRRILLSSSKLQWAPGPWYVTSWLSQSTHGMSNWYFPWCLGSAKTMALTLMS